MSYKRTIEKDKRRAVLFWNTNLTEKPTRKITTMKNYKDKIKIKIVHLWKGPGDYLNTFAINEHTDVWGWIRWKRKQEGKRSVRLKQLLRYILTPSSCNWFNPPTIFHIQVFARPTSTSSTLLTLFYISPINTSPSVSWEMFNWRQ